MHKIEFKYYDDGLADTHDMEAGIPYEEITFAIPGLAMGCDEVVEKFLHFMVALGYHECSIQRAFEHGIEHLDCKIDSMQYDEDVKYGCESE